MLHPKLIKANIKQKQRNPIKYLLFLLSEEEKNIFNYKAVPNGSADFRDTETLTDCISCCLPEGFKSFCLLK